jgi:hypothetical protein
MSDTSSPATTDETKTCKVCGESIKKAARVCIHCKNYQDWRAELNISSTVLSLLVALGSVLTVAVPVIISALTPKNSDFIFSFQGSNSAFIEILATNKGIRPGTVRTTGMLEMNEATKGFNGPLLRLDGASDDMALVITPAESKLLHFILVVHEIDQRLLHGDRLSFPTEASCKVWLDITDFVGRFSHDSVEMDCGFLSGFVRNMQNGLIKQRAKPPS